MKINFNSTLEDHMEAHKGEFLSDWKILLEQCLDQEKIQSMTKDFEIIELYFEDAIGYNSLVEVTSRDTILYAKRVGRQIHSRFVKNKSRFLCNALTLILRKDRIHPDSYDLITMYVGSPSVKEPEDHNIATKNELIESLMFWTNHAFVYDEAIIDITTERKMCPYKNLYFVTAA